MVCPSPCLNYFRHNYTSYIPFSAPADHITNKLHPWPVVIAPLVWWMQTHTKSGRESGHTCISSCFWCENLALRDYNAPLGYFFQQHSHCNNLPPQTYSLAPYMKELEEIPMQYWMSACHKLLPTPPCKNYVMREVDTLHLRGQASTMATTGSRRYWLYHYVIM